MIDFEAAKLAYQNEVPLAHGEVPHGSYHEKRLKAALEAGYREHLACPTCSKRVVVSSYRIEAEGMPWCTHTNGITYGSEAYPTWTRMVYE